MRRKPLQLASDVRELLTSGRLHLFDAEWITRLPPAKQLTAARKCMKTNGFTVGDERVKSRIAHGSMR